MRRRHPHLFDLGDAEPWERIKRKERRGRTLAGIVPTLPPLLKAYRLQERAASVGFDWPDARGPAGEGAGGAGGGGGRAGAPGTTVRAARPQRPEHTGATATMHWLEEIGDLLFAVVNLARKAGVQPGPALDRANRKFRDRFEAIERLAEERGIEIDRAGLEAWIGCGTRSRQMEEAKV